MIIFYGSPMSSAGRTHWTLEEVGVPYEYRKIDIKNNESEKKEFIANVNPGGKVPFLIDGDLKLAESMAINFYLVERYKPELMFTDVAKRALVYQWSFWSISNLLQDTIKVLAHTIYLPEAKRNPMLAEQGRKACAHYLTILEKELSGDYLVGDRFSVADINAGSVVNLGIHGKVFQVDSKIGSWIEQLRARPAFQKAFKAGSIQ